MQVLSFSKSHARRKLSLRYTHESVTSFGVTVTRPILGKILRHSDVKHSGFNHQVVSTPQTTTTSRKFWHRKQWDRGCQVDKLKSLPPDPAIDNSSQRRSDWTTPTEPTIAIVAEIEIMIAIDLTNERESGRGDYDEPARVP
jgi:hypothetical protein